MTTSPRIALALIGLVAACGADKPVTDCPAPDGATIVRAPAGPGAWGVGHRRLTELWRVGGTNEGEELSAPAGVAVAPDGRVAVPDWELAEVAIVSADGRWLGRWGRRGAGPGELRAPAAANWTDDGRLAVLDLAAPRVTFYDDGEPLEADVPVDPDFVAPVFQAGQVEWVAVRPDGGVLLTHLGPVTDGVRRRSVLLLRPGASAADTLVAGDTPVLGERVASLPAPGWAIPRAALGGGRIATASGTRYAVSVRGDDGGPARVVCRDVPPLPMDERETTPNPTPVEGDHRSIIEQTLEAYATAPRP